MSITSIPEKIPTELIYFESGASLPKYIEITHRLNHRTVTIGRYLLNVNPGAIIGTTQHAVLVHDGPALEMEWLLPNSDHLEQRQMGPGDIYIHPSDTLIYKRWHTSSQMLFMAIDRAFIKKIVDEVFDRRTIDLKPRKQFAERTRMAPYGSYREVIGRP